MNNQLMIQKKICTLEFSPDNSMCYYTIDGLEITDFLDILNYRSFIYRGNWWKPPVNIRYIYITKKLVKGKCVLKSITGIMPEIVHYLEKKGFKTTNIDIAKKIVEHYKNNFEELICITFPTFKNFRHRTIAKVDKTFICYSVGGFDEFHVTTVNHQGIMSFTMDYMKSWFQDLYWRYRYLFCNEEITKYCLTMAIELISVHKSDPLEEPGGYEKFIDNVISDTGLVKFCDYDKTNTKKALDDISLDYITDANRFGFFPTLRSSLKGFLINFGAILYAADHNERTHIITEYGRNIHYIQLLSILFGFACEPILNNYDRHAEKTNVLMNEFRRNNKEKIDKYRSVCNCVTCNNKNMKRAIEFTLGIL